jgi:hypothetical protein
MSLQSVFPFVLDFPGAKPIVLEVSHAKLTSDAGLLPIRQFDEQLRFTEQFAAALQDTRDPAFSQHSLLSMVRQRLYGILADYEDQNDHDTLRSDPVFKLLAGRLPDESDLASQPTLSRFENAVSIPDLWRLRDVLVDQFLGSFKEPPSSLTLDLDAFDDPTHGAQQLTLFHGYYRQYQYLPLAITCAENDFVLLVGLRHGTCAAFLGADDDLRYLVGRLRAVWPDVHLHVRGDSGFASPAMYGVCAELGLTYTFGIGMNPRLQRESDELLSQAVEQYEQTGVKQRLFMSFWYQADSWDRERYVIIKAEAHVQGTNRRAVVTNRPGAVTLPEATYDEYTQRGESENRNKELKCGMRADRLSDHRFLANFFRLYLHAGALNLFTLLRRQISHAPTPAELGILDPVPAEALCGRSRKTFFNRRREADPLGEGHPCTWRTRLIKVAAEVLVSARRVVVRLSSHWPHLRHLADVAGQVLGLAPD